MFKVPEHHLCLSRQGSCLQRFERLYKTRFKAGHVVMANSTDQPTVHVPAGLLEVQKLARTPRQRAPDIRAHFDGTRPPNRTKEVIKG